MATRRLGAGVFDHGAQYFTVRSDAFRTFVDEWIASGIVAEWFRRFPVESGTTGHPRYYCPKGMTAVAKHLGADLDIRTGVTVCGAFRKEDCWELQTLEGPTFHSEFLVLSAPVPQSMAILDSGVCDLRPQDLSILRNIEYLRSLTLLVELDGPSSLPEFGGTKIESGCLTWVADNRIKGISPEGGGLTLHSTYEFGKRYWDEEDTEITRRMLDGAKGCLGEARVVGTQVKRWRFNIPLNPTEAHFFFSRRNQLLLIGDGFGGPRVEGSALSGIEGAKCLLEII